MKVASTIGKQGQVTIPEAIRKVISWIKPESSVTISVINPDEISIRPQEDKKEVDWDKLWAGIKKVRAFKGKGKIMSAVEFLEKDRKSH